MLTININQFLLAHLPPINFISPLLITSNSSLPWISNGYITPSILNEGQAISPLWSNFQAHQFLIFSTFHLSQQGLQSLLSISPSPYQWVPYLISEPCQSNLTNPIGTSHLTLDLLLLAQVGWSFHLSIKLCTSVLVSSKVNPFFAWIQTQEVNNFSTQLILLIYLCI